MPRLFTALALTAVLFSVTGCAKGPRVHTVRGTVSLDGAAVSEGDITFIPADPALGPTQGKIKDGRFEFLAVEGQNRVEISASKVRPGGARGAGGEPVPEEYIPERYNTASTLTADVGAGGASHYEFKLKGREK